MENEKKKLSIRAALVDMTRASEETFAAYSQIKIASALVLVSERTRNLIGKYNVQIASATVMDAPEGARLSSLNGNVELTPGSFADEPALLIVNGNVLIHPDSGDALKSYTALMFNGNVFCPDNLRGALSKAVINGNIKCYPSAAKLVNGDLAIDRRFIRKAEKDDLYYVRGKTMMLQENLDVNALIEKDVTIMTDTAILRAEYEPASDLIDGMPNIHYLPEGYAFIDGEVKMDESISMRYGKKLFIYGDLSIAEDAMPLAEQFDDIIITGRLKLKEEQKRAWLKTVSRFGGLWVYRGRLIEDMVDIKISKSLLESSREPITFHDCVNVEIDEDIAPELLREKIIEIVNCVNIICSKEQLGAVQLLAADCVNIESRDDRKTESEDDGGEWVKIDAAQYTM